MSRTAWWQPRARAWRWPPPTLRTCSTGCCSNGTVRSEEHTSELQSPCNLVCRLLSSKEHTSELQSPCNLVCRLLLEKKNMVATLCGEAIPVARYLPSYQAYPDASSCAYRTPIEPMLC